MAVIELSVPLICMLQRLYKPTMYYKPTSLFRADVWGINVVFGQVVCEGDL